MPWIGLSSVIVAFLIKDSLKLLDKVEHATYVSGGVCADGRTLTGADPGFFDGGVHIYKGGLIC